MAKLSQVGGEGGEYELAQETTVGRSSTSNVQLMDKKASRNHAVIKRQGEAFVIEDQESSNGVYVNGERVRSRELATGDRIRICESEFIFTGNAVATMAGVQLKGYLLQERIGAGSMGAVYRAIQLSMDRQVAVKMLKDSLASDPAFSKRFQEEAKLAGRLNHKNIIKVHDFGSAEGKLFFSMEYVSGANLAEVVRREGKLPPDRALQLIAQAADGLAHAHGLGITHQDIKPLNLMLSEDGTVKIADLGLAKNIGSGDGGIHYGTPAYVAPEIVRHLPPDARSDIYSLGATLYHLLTGVPPFTGKDTKDVVRSQLDHAAPDPCATVPSIPRAVGALVQKMMAKDPSSRPASASAAANEARALAVTLSKKTLTRPATPAASSPARQSQEHSLATKASASLVMYVGSIAAVVALAAIGYYITKPGAENQASEKLSQAKSVARSGDLSSASRLAGEVIAEYPGTTAAASAAELRKEWDKPAISAAQEAEAAPANSATTATPAPTTAPAAARSPAEAAREAGVSASAPPSASGSSAAAAGKKDNERAWSETEAAVARFLQAKQPQNAVLALRTFMSNYPQSPNTAKAEARLAELEKKASEDFEGKMKDAEVAIAGNKAAEGRSILEGLLVSCADDKAAKVLSKLATIDATQRDRYFAKRAEMLSCFARLDVAPAHQIANALATSLDGSPWEGPANRLQTAADAIDYYRQALASALRRDRPGGPPTTGIPGKPGAYRLQANSNGELMATPANPRDGKEPIPAKWMDLPADALWDLAPSSKLDARERLGAVMHFTAREHLGYVRTFLKDIPASSSFAAMLRDIKGWEAGRVAVYTFDFTSFEQNSRWKPLEGTWDTSAGKLVSSGEKAKVALMGKTWNLANFALAGKFSVNGSGVGRLVLDGCQNGNLSLTLGKDEWQISLDAQGKDPRTVKGEAPPADAAIKFQVVDGLASVSANGKDICGLDLPESAGMWCVLLVEADSATVTADDISIEEGIPLPKPAAAAEKTPEKDKAQPKGKGAAQPPKTSAAKTPAKTTGK